MKKYGADPVWVDWEWYHKDLTGVRDDGCDCFNPDKEKYPNINVINIKSDRPLEEVQKEIREKIGN